MIREMRKEDWNEMTAIYKQSLEKGNVTFTTDCPSYEEWDAAHIKECRYVYELDGKVVGYTMIAPTSKREPYRGVVEMSIFVDKNYLRQGIGTALLSTLCTETEKKGYWTLYSAIFSVNEASIELHKKCGFRVIGIRENIAKDRFGEWQSTTIMERRSGSEKMSEKEIIRRFYEEVITNNESERIADFIAEDCVVKIGEQTYPMGVNGMKEHLIATKKTYPDYSMKIIRQFQEGSTVVSEFIMTGTHEGEWIGIHPTHKILQFSGVDIDKVVNGKIVEHGGAVNTFDTFLEEGLIKPV